MIVGTNIEAINARSVSEIEKIIPSAVCRSDRKT